MNTSQSELGYIGYIGYIGCIGYTTHDSKSELGYI